MKARPNTMLSCSTGTNQRQTPVLRLLLTLLAGMILVVLTLAVSTGMAAGAAAPPPVAPAAAPPAESAAVPVAASPGLNAARTAMAPLAAITNGDFETGDLTGWTVGGTAAHVAAVGPGNFTPFLPLIGGNYAALLCTGPGPVAPATPAGNIDLDLQNTPEYDTSSISSGLITLGPQDVPATLSFDWKFMSSEAHLAPDVYDDFFVVTLGTSPILAGSRPGGNSPFSDVALQLPAEIVTAPPGPNSPNGCQFTWGQTRWNHFETIISTPGSYNLQFLVADQGDAYQDSGLLVDNVQLIPEVDLAITKTAQPDPAIPGDKLVYNVTVKNYGTGKAVGVFVTDTLPLPVTYITSTLPDYATLGLPGGCSYDAGTRQVLCNLGDILGGTSVSFQIEVFVDPMAIANGNLNLHNTAQVDSITPDKNLSNNTFILETLLDDRADLRVLKMSKPDLQVRAGDTFTYTIFVDNLGPSAARNVVLTDTILSSGLFSLVRVTPDPARAVDSCAPTTAPNVPGQVIVCSLGEPLEPQPQAPGNGRWKIVMEVKALQGADINNIVDVFSVDPDGVAGKQTATFDPDLSNNRSIDFISVLAVADLHLTKIGYDAGSNPDGNRFTALAGESISWTLTISNSGPSPAENVSVVDVLPRELVANSVSVIAVTPRIGGGQCVVGTPGDPLEPLICNIGNLQPNQVATITIIADIDPSFVANQPNTKFADYLPNGGSLKSSTLDPDTADNVVYDALVRVLALDDLVVTKISQPTSVRAGDPLDFLVKIFNRGPSTAEDTFVTDKLPPGVKFLNATLFNANPGSNCDYAVGAHAVLCSLGDLVPAPPTVTLLINTLVYPSTPAGPLTNSISAASVTADVNITNNTEITATTVVETQVDLDITKTSTPSQVNAGEVQKYSIDVINLGPSDALTVTVTDTLPVSLTYLVDTNHCLVTGTTPAGAQILLCRYGRQIGPIFVYEPLPPGGEWQFDIYALVDPALLPGTTITNTAFVTSANSLGDSNMVNNTATSKSLVEEKADLKIVKFGKPDEKVRAGEILTYTVIVDNLGPSYATSVALKDVLQASLSFDLIDITSDRTAICSALTEGATRVYSNTLVPGTPWPPTVAPPPFGVLPPTGIANINQRLQIDCTLENTATPALGDGRLEVLKADGPPNSGRWILTIRVRAPQTQSLNNIADVTSAAFDPNPANNHAEVKHAITDVADLVVTKTELGEVTVDSCPPGVALAPNRVSAGLNLTYTVVITNNGPSPAENTVLLDRLPPWLIVTGYTTTQGACETGTPGSPLDKLTCGLGTIQWHGVVTVTINAHVPTWVPNGKILENDVYVYSDIWDPWNGNNYATNLTTVSADADLILNKDAVGEVVTGYNTNTFSDVISDTVGAVTAGKLVKFTLTVTNTGPSDAQDVVITDTLPDRTFVLVNSFGAPCRADPIDPTKVTCWLGTVPAGAVRVVELLVLTLPDAANPDPVKDTPNTRTVTNRAGVTSATHDPCPANNFDSATVLVNAVANLAVTKTDIPDPVLAGEEVRYIVTASNLGPSKARAVVLTDTLPAGLVFVRCEPVDPDEVPVCSATSPLLNPTGQQMVTVSGFRINGQVRDDLLPGEVRSAAIVAYVRSNLVKDPNIYSEPDAVGNLVTITDTVTITQARDIQDYYLANNVDRELTGATSAADLAVRKTETPNPTPDSGYLTFDPVTNSWVYTYYITVENLGPSDAGRVILEDRLPPNVTLDGPPESAIQVGAVPAAAFTPTVRFRDDGTVFVDFGQIAGNDGRRPDLTLNPVNPNLPTTRTLTIRVRVDANVAPDIRTLYNTVMVYTVPGNVCPTNLANQPCTPIATHGYTPTPDPNPANNIWVEPTSLVSPRVAVDKKAYLLRSPARGIDNSGLDRATACATIASDNILVLPGDEVMYCYDITNPGDTWLSSITLSDATVGITRTATSNFAVVYPPKPPLRGTVFITGTGESQIIQIVTFEPEKAVLAPRGTPDDYNHILIVRSYTVDFPPRNPGDPNACLFTLKGSNVATVTAIASTKYSTPLPGAPPAVGRDTLNDTLSVPVLEDTTKNYLLFEDQDLDGLVGPGDTVKYVVDIPNTGGIAATGVTYTDILYNYISDNANDARVPGLLVNGSVAAALHVTGQDPVSGEVFDFDVQPPALAYGQALLLETQAPGVSLVVDSASVLPTEIVKGNAAGDDEIQVKTRIAIPPQGNLLRIGGRVLPRPVAVTFSLRVVYLVKIKETVAVDVVVLNQGWVWYREIDVFDQRFNGDCVKFDPNHPDASLEENREANNHAGTPGKGYYNVEQPGWPTIPPGVEPTDFPGPRFDGYPRDDDDPTWFVIAREAPSIGADSRIQLPVLNHIGRDKANEVVVEIQNAGRRSTSVIMFLWGPFSGYCAAQSPGPLKAECSGIIKPGESWVWRLDQMPDWAASGIAYSVPTTELPGTFLPPHPSWPVPHVGQAIDEYLCEAAQEVPIRNPYNPWDEAPYNAWRTWEDVWEKYFQGEPLAVWVVRRGPGSPNQDVEISGGYEGISRAMEGVQDPVSDGWQYYVPNAYADSEGFTSWLYIQNSGDRCVSVELWLRAVDECIRPVVCSVPQLAPGETATLDLTTHCGMGPGWQGSITLRSSDPLGIVVDNIGRDVLLTSRGVPADIDYGTGYNGPQPYFTAGSYINYAPLIYREYQGWQTKIWVQNMSSIYAAKVKVYFLDKSGDIITTIVDWVCPRGSQAFYLPFINALPGNYVGAVRVESQDWWSPGDPPVDAPRILSVAELLKFAGPTGELLEGIAYNLFGEDEAYDWQIGAVETWGVRRIALPTLSKRADGMTTEIAIQNVVPSPGFTDFAIYFYDQNGLLDYVCEKLNQKQVEYIPIDTWGFIAPHFQGSAVISATYWTHLGANATGKSVGLAAVAVERSGTTLGIDIPGDESSGMQGIPIHKPFRFLRDIDLPKCPGQP